VTYFFETYGCQMNKAESAALELVLAERGWTAAPDGDSADLVLINTCSVRATAEARVFGRLGLYAARKRTRPFRLVLAGCMAERLKDDIVAKAPMVDHVLGTSNKALFPRILDSIESGRALASDDVEPAFSFAASHLEAGSFRSFVPIMHGCDNFCSYCIVPYVRGREVSRPPEAVLAEIDSLEAAGVREITLLGQNVNSYRWVGEDGRTVDFPALLRLVAGRVKAIRWVRFLSSHPKDLSSEAIAVISEHPVFCRHLHLCVQSGSDPVLEAMNRRYSRSRYLALVAEVRSALPDVSLSTDILIGFPGETEADAQATLDLMAEVGFAYSYMYHYNPREGTAAFALPGRVPDAVKKERLARVIELQKRLTRDALKARVGRRATVLVEGFSKRSADEVVARTERDEMVVFKADPSWIGAFAEVTLAALRGNTFKATEAVRCGA
jgi:tRNA-2-methylthio-N6-dimethylallyladenosine synthase